MWIKPSNFNQKMHRYVSNCRDRSHIKLCCLIFFCFFPQKHMVRWKYLFLGNIPHNWCSNKSGGFNCRIQQGNKDRRLDSISAHRSLQNVWIVNYVYLRVKEDALLRKSQSLQPCIKDFKGAVKVSKAAAPNFLIKKFLTTQNVSWKVKWKDALKLFWGKICLLENL